MPYLTAIIRGKYSGKGLKKLQKEELNPRPQPKKVQRIRQYTISDAMQPLSCAI